MWTLKAIASMLKAVFRGEDVQVSSVSIDTRTLQPGSLFFAIRGENHDGHAFIREAEKKGAAAIVVDHWVETSLPQMKVEETTLALGAMAGWHRAQFQLPLIAVTGSYGKTTVKEMIKSILQQAGPTLGTEGTLNNYWGVPLTLLQLSEVHQYAVLELGANHPGEIAHLTQIAKPTVALITVADVAHLAGFGGSIQSIAQVKAEIFQGLSPTGTAILNRDDPHFSFWHEQLSALSRQIISFGVEQQADVMGEMISVDAIGCVTGLLKTVDHTIPVTLPLPGLHQLRNATAAAAACLATGISWEHIQKGLETTPAVRGRLVIKSGIQGACILDDTYNASPGAMKAALDLLARYKGRRIAVLSDMLELGEDGPQYHRDIGVYAKSLGLEALWTYGPLSAHIAAGYGGDAKIFQDQFALITELQQVMDAQTTILVKGSRGMKMEYVVNALLA